MRDSQFSEHISCQDTIWNQSETMGTSKEPKNAKMAKRVIFKVETIFSRIVEKLKVFWTLHMSGYLLEPCRDKEAFKVSAMDVKYGPKGDFQRR